MTFFRAQAGRDASPRGDLAVGVACTDGMAGTGREVRLRGVLGSVSPARGLFPRLSCSSATEFRLERANLRVLFSAAWSNSKSSYA